MAEIDAQKLAAQVELGVELEVFLQSSPGRAFIKRIEEHRMNALEHYGTLHPTHSRAEEAFLHFLSLDKVQAIFAELIVEGETANQQLEQMQYTDD
ncbi:MAG: hypothetical protein AB8B85_02705 [Paracoccaceae bacterium]